MPFILFSDSSTSVTLEPEWDYEERLVKIETRTRTPLGAEYAYQSGSYRVFKVPVEWVNEAARDQIEEWREDNAELVWQEVGTSSGTAVRITDESTPLDRRNRPYLEYFKGSITLETF